MDSTQREPVERSTEAAEHFAPAGCRRSLVVWVLLAAYAAFLVYRAVGQGRADDAAPMPIWELQDAHRLVAWGGGLALAVLYQFAYFVPVGFLAVLAVPCGRRRMPVWGAGTALAGALAVAVVAVEIGTPWPARTVARLILPLLGCLFGVWIGVTWRRGRRARLWLLPKVALLFFATALCGAILVWSSVEDKPLPFQAAPVTSARKRELVRLVRSKSPRALQAGQTHTLRLTEDDVNVLLAWGLSLGPADGKARVTFGPEVASLAASVDVARGGKSRYLNLRMAGDVAIKDGSLNLRIDRCRLGRVEIPAWLIAPWCSDFASLLGHDRRVQPFLDAIQAITIGPDWIEATYTRVNLPPGFREDLFGPAGAGEEVLAATRMQVDRLLTIAEQLPRGARPDVGMCFETAFALARQRSVHTDPVTENRAAIFALGVLLGHHRLEEFLGPVLPEGRNGARWMLRRVELRGRADWMKHFCVSAALALLSDAVVSDAAGLLKEELDADRGGSGFSFSDLLADRAGTTFAVRATEDEAAARRMQDRLARGFKVDDFFPPAADLPEGIPDAELQTRYGGVGGAPYLRQIDEIERRVAACAAYR